jgi:hypothetical protein
MTQRVSDAAPATCESAPRRRPRDGRNDTPFKTGQRTYERVQIRAFLWLRKSGLCLPSENVRLAYKHSMPYHQLPYTP